jgi:hypothetical protein
MRKLIVVENNFNFKRYKEGKISLETLAKQLATVSHQNSAVINPHSPAMIPQQKRSVAPIMPGQLYVLPKDSAFLLFSGLLIPLGYYCRDRSSFSHG